MRKKVLEKQVRLLKEAIDQLMPNGASRFDEPDGTSSYVIVNHIHNDDVDNGPEEPPMESPELPLNKRAEILQTAEDLINGDRAQTYGAPEISFGRIADIWNAQGYRHHVQVPDQPIGVTKANKLDAVDAALILIGMKLSRTVGGRQQMDNWIDMAGYSGLGGELASSVNFDPTLLKGEVQWERD